MPKGLDAPLFTRQEYEALKNAQRELHDAIRVMDKAEKCGVNCEDYRALHEHLSTFFANVEREFMSPPPKA